MIRHYFAGADISASWFDIAVLDGRRIHEGRFGQDETGFAQLEAWLLERGLLRLWIAMEHTGGYERRLAQHLYVKGHRVCLVDGLQLRRFKESLKVKAKTDKVDARVLARFAKDRKPALWTPRPDSWRELTELVHHRQDLVDAITAWKCRKSGPCSNAAVRAQQNTLLQVLQMQLKEAQDQIARLVESSPDLSRDVELLCTVKGVKFTTATAFLAESGPIEAYPSPKSLALAAGLAPLPFQSGSSIKRGHSAPYGNAHMRRALSIIAPGARRFNPAMACFASRIAARGGKTNSLLNRAVMRKLVHVFWGVLKRKQPFDPAKAVWRFPKEPMKL